MKVTMLKASGSAILTAFLLLPASARAQAPGDDFWVQLSGYWAHVDTDISVSATGSSAVGTSIDLEQDLGLDDSTFLPSVFAGARLGGGFSVGAEYYALGRDTTGTLARDILFEDVTYPASGEVSSEFNTDIYRATFGWAFIRSETAEVGAALGLHATRVEVALAGRGSVDGSDFELTERRHDFLAPLPTVGIFASVELMPRLTASARIDYLSLSVGDYDGRLINAQASLAYRLLENVGVGAMYRYVDYRVGVEKAEYTGRFDYEFRGPAIFIELGF